LLWNIVDVVDTCLQNWCRQNDYSTHIVILAKRRRTACYCTNKRAIP